VKIMSQTLETVGDVHPDSGRALAEDAANARLLARAIRSVWPVSQAMRDRIVAVLARVLDRQDHDTRTLLTAIDALILAEQQNLAVSKLDDPKKPADI
jgi:hypothetical protein